jgi:hypothetical protein
LEDNMAKKIGFIIALIVALLAVGAGSFYGGTVYAAQQAASTRAAFFNGRGGAPGGAGATGAGAAGGFGGGVSGTVQSVSGDTLTVGTAQGVTTVTLSGSTTILKSQTGTAGDLQVGQQVTVRGARDSSGNVAATSIQVVPAGATLGGGPGARPTATPAP